MTAAAYYHLVVRRNLHIEQAARARYQQAMHFVTHEMRTPLSAIQGSSELISRYALTDEKRKQIALLINRNPSAWPACRDLSQCGAALRRADGAESDSPSR